MSDRPIILRVQGKPVPQGSMRHVGHGRMLHKRELQPWRDSIAHAAREQGLTAQDRACKVSMMFVLPRPQSHWKGGRGGQAAGWVLRSGAEHLVPRGRPDLDKLIRAVGDGLTGSVLTDDALIIDLSRSCKAYQHDEWLGVIIEIRWLEPSPLG